MKITLAMVVWTSVLGCRDRLQGRYRSWRRAKHYAKHCTRWDNPNTGEDMLAVMLRSDRLRKARWLP